MLIPPSLFSRPQQNLRQSLPPPTPHRTPAKQTSQPIQQENRLITKPKSYRSLVIGKSGSGKTSLAMHLYDKIKEDIQQLIVVTPSIETQPAYKALLTFPKLHVFETLSIKNLKKINKILKDTPPDEQSLLFMDDVTASRALNDRDKGLFSKFVFNARWLKLHIILCSHKIKAVAAAMRENADDVYLFKLRRETEKQAAWQEFGQDLKHPHYTRHTKKAWVKPHGFLYIHRDAIDEFHPEGLPGYQPSIPEKENE
jgi:Poxvirus A32 protein